MIFHDDVTITEEEPSVEAEPEEFKAKVVDSVTAEKPEEAREVINLAEIKAQNEKITLLGNEITELRKHFDYSEAIEKLINN